MFVNSNAVVELCGASEEPESKCMGGGTKDQRRREATGRKWFKNKLPVVGENAMTVDKDHNIFFITQYCTQKPGGRLTWRVKTTNKHTEKESWRERERERE